AEDNYEKVFEAFASLTSPEGRQSRGDGLGLYISRRIARQLGGDVQIKGQVGSGTAFTLTVPLLRAESVVPQTESEAEAEQSAPRARSNQNILIVEDNSVNRSVLRDMLLGMGHRVFEATNGKEALESVEDTLFDLIIMDISMPVMDGIEATKRLRMGSSQNVNTVVIGLTAHGREEFRERAKQAGMNTFYTKPIRLPTLRRVIDGELEAVAFHVSGSVLDDASIAELVAAIGGKKALEASERFFKEFDQFVEKHSSAENISDDEEWRAEIHKLRGAAAMLGMTELESRLAKLKSKKADFEALTTGLVAVANIGQQTRELFKSRVGDAQIAGSIV
ncbi:MAG: response regulator, partial [Pseudomonadota bacterium]